MGYDSRTPKPGWIEHTGSVNFKFRSLSEDISGARFVYSPYIYSRRFIYESTQAVDEGACRLANLLTAVKSNACASVEE